MTDKGWSLGTLYDLGVTVEDALRPYVFQLEDADGKPCGIVRYSPNGADPKMKADPGTVRELWPRPETVGGDVLYVVEGEPDSLSMAEIGLQAVALPGSGKYRAEWSRRLAAGRRLVALICDCDGVGRVRMRREAEKIARLGVEARVIELDAARDDGYDVGDLLAEQGPDVARVAIESLTDAAEPWAPEPVSDLPATSVGAIRRALLRTPTARGTAPAWRGWRCLGPASCCGAGWRTRSSAIAAKARRSRP